MENKMLNIIKYILVNYPHKDELSASRLTKMVFLIDWKSCIDNSHQITNCTWYFNHFGPYVEDIVKLAKKDPYIKVNTESTIFGNRKTKLSIVDNFDQKLDLSDEEFSIVSFVIETTKSKNYNDFINLVYSTYPIITSEKYTSLDLVKLAREYKEVV